MKLITANEFYKFFESIPDERWCCDYLENDKGQKCALGLAFAHEDCGKMDESNYLFFISHQAFKVLNRPLDFVNDGRFLFGLKNPFRFLTTPKQRVVKAFKKAMERR